MDILVKIIQFFLCFTILIGIHEMGHFIMARVFKIRVEKFYIFFDPWFSLFKFKRGQTEYGIGWLPLGGYVKIAGMIDESLDTDQMAQEPKPDEFRSKPAWQRFIVMIAGIVMNVLLAFVIYSGICYTWGTSYFSNQDAQWGYTFNDEGKALGFKDGDKFVSIAGEPIDDINSILNTLLITKDARTVVVERGGMQVDIDIPLDKIIEMRKTQSFKTLFAPRIPFIIDSVKFASAAALQHGDQIVGFNGTQLFDYMAYKRLLAENRGKEVTLSVLRNGETQEMTLPIDSEGHLGIITQNPFPIRTQHYTLLQAIPAGIHKTGEVIASYWEQLKLIVQPKSKMYEELGGFIAIGSIFPGQWDWQDFWFKTAFLSIILAVINLLPIPGLDGGHALFTFWEMVTRRRPSDKFLLGAQYVGLVIILALLLYANGNDIYRFFIK